VSEIDPVILQLRADLNGYLSDLRRSTNSVDQMLGAQEKRARQLEEEMRRSSEAIKGHIKGLAGVLTGAFTGRELLGMIDSFTRLQNNLRVAGVAGEEMKAVQDRLYESAQKYGVEIEGLSGLFSSLTQASKELGASQTQVFAIADAVSASLKVTGSSAAEAGGALQQLQQVFRGSKVQAEEYNSLIDGLYPLLEAAAAGSAKWGGSVGKLTADVKASKVTSAEFFQAILQGSDVLEGKATNAHLTLSAGVTTLTNALTVYVGEADKANGISGALGDALGLIARNLDTFIPALAAVATLISTKYVVGMVAAAAATVANTVAEVRGVQVAAAYVAAQAEVAGMLGIEAAAAARATASVTALSVAQGVAARAGSSLLALVGGPLGTATLALGAAIYLVSQRAEGLDKATGAYARVQHEANAATSKAAELAQKLATAHGKAREEALALARAEQENIKKKLESARASLTLAQAELARAKAARVGQNNAATYAGGSAAGIGTSAFIRGTGDAGVSKANANVKAAEDAVGKLEKSISDIGAAISAGAATPVAAGDTKSKKGKSPKGPSAAEVTQRFNDELASLAQQTLSAEQSVAKSAQERAEFELRGVEIARLRALDGIQSEKDYSAAQKERLKQQVEVLAVAERERIAFEEKVRLEQEAQDLAQERYNNERDVLQAQYDLADSQSERKRIALEMLDLEERYQRALLQAIISSETASKAEQQRAEVALDGLNAASSGRREAASRNNETPLEAYRRRLNRSEGAVQDQIESYVVEELDQVRDGIRGAIEKRLGIKDPLISGLLNMLIENVVMKPLAEALSKSGGGGGGLLGSIVGGIGAIFGGSSGFGSASSINSSALASLRGRASGGRVNAGEMYRVNEAGSPGRVEGFIPQGSGTVIPLGQMNSLIARPGGGEGKATVRLELSGDIDARIQQVSGPVAVEVVRASAPALVEASAQETMRRASRPRI
jgi:tape measure domain-containing protein